MGIKSIKTTITVYDPEDTSVSDLMLYGVNVGQYHNEVMAAHMMSSDTWVADYEKYICHRLSDELGISITKGVEVAIANERCKELYGMNIGSWAEELMNKEAHRELLRMEE